MVGKGTACRAVSQSFRNHPILARKACYGSGNWLEIICKPIDLLNSDDDFAETNSTRHSQFTAALAAVERYYAGMRREDLARPRSKSRE